MRLDRRNFLAASLGGVLSAQQSPPRTNVIVILADDLGAADLGCYGSTFHDTPNLNRLAASGTQFNQAYAACPVCSPTRASLLTGKYPARLHLTDWIPGRKQWPQARVLTPSFEQQLPLAETTIAEVLKPHGYLSASIGKWHLGGAGFLPTDQGFDSNIGGSERGSPPSYFPPYRIPGIEERFDKDYLTDNLAQRAVRFIEQNRSKPFFLYLPHFAVHTPLQAKADLEEKYRQRAARGRAQSDPTYAAMLESLDDAVGRVTKILDETGLADRTAVIFLSDNGGLRHEGRNPRLVTDNSPFRAGKGHLYEGGTRIPFLVRWPGITRAGSTSDSPVCSIDVLPTIAELLNISSPPRVDGVSLAAPLRGRSLGARQLYWHYPHYSNQGGVPGGSVRDGEWKLIEFYEDKRLELFNLADDVGERRNLVQREAGRSRRLLDKLRAWRQSVQASMPEPNPGYDPAKADQGLAGYEKPTPPA